ncbi:translocation and assembly module lipoprotein TamL [Pseudofulvibacter geojedonensis]|uniref:Outer membrane protein assembly factor n=1 Tax=Pseudofulvibacter geojedonensis TaxID=1123758 RepID=A0ABW3I1I1_9FLAO
MKLPILKIFLSIFIFIISSCSITKDLKENENLLTENLVTIDGKTSKNSPIKSIIKPKKNADFLWFPLRAHIYNLAHKNPDSAFVSWLNKKPKRKERLYKMLSKKQTIRLQNSFTNIHKWLQKSGEPPAIIDSSLIKKTISNIDKYYSQNGWRDAKTNYTIDYFDHKKAKVNYSIETNEPYIIDSISQNISSKAVDSVYSIYKKSSFIKLNKQYNHTSLINERERINNIMRNSGFYTFEKESIFFDSWHDSIAKTMWVDLIIKDKKTRTIDSTYKEPYKTYKISEVNVFTDFTYKNKGKAITDSASYNNHNFFSFDKQRYKPKALSNAIAIHKGSIYRDIDKSQTLRQLNNLRTFKYPNIKYTLDPSDSTNTNLIANVLLTPLKKFSLDAGIDALHNNIQNVGLAFSTSILARNVFRGAENLELAFRGSIGASKDASDSKDEFFDIRELGADLKLSFPRILFPVKTNKIIPNTMNPTTRISLGASNQTNIGLDKRTFSGAFNYRWFPSSKKTIRFDLFNAQFVRNLNPNNYFSVYESSYSSINQIAINSTYTTENLSIPEGVDQFIFDALSGNLPTSVSDLISGSTFQEISNIEERRQRLTENNLIFGSSFSYIHNTRTNLLDNHFTRFGAKLELAGNSLASLSNLLGLQKNSDDRYELFNVEYSQFIKTELDIIKYWDLSRDNIIALRSFFGIAIPYGNSNSIPFAKSFFAGGANDNRAWKAYGLGPGISGSFFEFNEANMKIALNAEYRFNVFGDMKGALFTDIGNIWNVLDNVEDESYRFTSLKDLSELAIGSGIGLRYDFGFFLLRFDTGFKTYEPYLNNKKWLTNYNFKNAVYNLGINYPF